MGSKAELHAEVGGIAGWVLARLRSTKKSAPRLALLERITLGPRQSLALVEAQGRCFLVATSTDGAPAFYALDASPHKEQSRSTRQSDPFQARVSW